VVLTLAITAISYYKLELPFLKLKDKIGHANKPVRSFDDLPQMEPASV
jgi:hypothetical protein